MIGQGLGRVALAEKLSIGQLQEALQNRTIPAYIGIPLLEEKMQFEQRMRMAGQQGIAPPMDQPPIADQVMAQASQMEGAGEGIDQLPVPTPEFAGGGIVAFEDGGQVERFQNQGLVADPNFGMGADQMSMPREELVNMLTLPELQEYNRSGKLPERLRSAIGSTPVESGSFLGSLPLTRQPAQFAAPPAPAAPTTTPAPAAPAAPAASTKPTPKAPKSDVSLITEEGKKLIPTQGITPESFKAQQAAFGIGADPDADFKKQIEALAKGSKEDRQQAKYMALLQAGLGIMGGTSRNALENISAGAQRGLMQYAGDIKDIKAQERDVMKMRAELSRAEDARKRGDFKAFMDAKDNADRLGLQQEKLNIDRQTAAVQKAYMQGRLSDSQARNAIAQSRVAQAQIQTTLKAREFFTNREEPALRSEFEKRFGSNWAKSPEIMAQFNRQKEGRIRELAMLGSQDSGIPSAEDLMED